MIVTDDDIYYERNMLALLLANAINKSSNHIYGKPKRGAWAGWYPVNDGRVISLFDGTICFSIPDDFDMGDLPEIAPNWNGHTTEDKWKTVQWICGVKQ